MTEGSVVLGFGSVLNEGVGERRGWRSGMDCGGWVWGLFWVDWWVSRRGVDDGRADR
jgi:hypothetical protein